MRLSALAVRGPPPKYCRSSSSDDPSFGRALQLLWITRDAKGKSEVVQVRGRGAPATAVVLSMYQRVYVPKGMGQLWTKGVRAG